MSDDTERILNPGKFTSAEPFKETAIHQAKERVIEAARKFHKRCEHNCNDGQVYDTGLCEALSALSELEGGGE